MRIQVCTLLFATLILCVISCGRGSDEKTWVGFPPEKISVAFIESLEFPEAIYAGEEFEIKVTLSAQLRPEVLNGRSEMDGVHNLNFLYSHPVSEELDPLPPSHQNLFNRGNVFFQEASIQVGDPTSEYVERGIVYIPGDYVLILSAAESREFGGYSSFTSQDTHWIYPRDHVAEFEFSFTVLPVPDAGE